MILDVPTSVGPGRLTIAAAAHPTAVLWLGHGAGGGIEAVDLAVLADRLPPLGVTVVRYEQPWRVAGKRVAARPATLDIAWRETAPRILELAAGLPLFVGGRSAGARVACRTASEVGAAGVVCLAFPLHPPGSPEKSRLQELLEPEVPVLVLQGTRDPFGSAETVAVEASSHDGVRVVPVPEADHGMRVAKSSGVTAADVRDLIAATVAGFVSVRALDHEEGAADGAGQP
ncbi:alpha/beta family hydrolase [Leifsonia sp. C5G2]|uniref:alpha/beta hydrolase family protein n=1 Tax=Leifsonia sp. C5G2 TaxID=2735269 RepID=UPI001585009F|nr:alpha/beta family hydrolase [Leifsonia sp. C5G2]NUU07353.1 hydrolase [Leifsonia sp. C5G2]